MCPLDQELVEKAEALAARLVTDAAGLETPADRRRRAHVAALVADPQGREFLIALTDQVLRIRDRARAARRLQALVDELGLPAFARGLDWAGLRAASRLAPVVPKVVMAGVSWRLRREFAATVLPAERAALSRHARHRQAQGVRLNVNLLGEAILGEQEAAQRMDRVVELLGRPDVGYVSVKISAICSRLNVIAYEDSVSRIVERLRRVLHVAAAAVPAKFVNLDMEEYRDLQLTVDSFVQVLSEPAFVGLDAGIVLQAYLPDSYAALERLAEFARERKRRHGSIVKVRLVKGANLAMERVESQLRGWPQAPFTSKAEVDANFKRLLDLAIDPRHEGAVRVGVASHNLFDIGWALAVRESTGAPIEIEMLEGMANPQALAAGKAAGDILLYVPVVAHADFTSAVAYLVRRFDENTSPENFLAHLFNLTVSSPDWERERAAFRAAVCGRHAPPAAPRRVQDVGAGLGKEMAVGARAAGEQRFSNTPDTDFTIAGNRASLTEAIATFRAGRPYLVNAVVDGLDVMAPLSGRGADPSEPGVLLYRYVEADIPTIDRAVGAARGAASAWHGQGARARAEILLSVAAIMSRDRGRTLATMMHDAGKAISEGDSEVSEAIDFGHYYAEQVLDLEGEGREDEGGTGGAPSRGCFKPHGVVVVAPPWNFPYAIPAGGVLAGLATGNTVILKPAPETVLTAAELARQCWEGGVPGDVLQFLPCADDEAGRHLVTHAGVDAVIFTGSWETARMFLGWRPDLRLHGETSGKNALVITAAADQDDAIRDLVHSAFSHSGQKCSAASLAIVEAPVYDDRHFLHRLADAVASLRVGPATDLATDIVPLVRPPDGALLRALTELDHGEKWLVEPRRDRLNPNLWSPGVKLGVLPGSEFYLTECFGPVLGLMRARDLDHALALQNGTAYGLTGGVHTLDPREIERWCAEVQVGNAYVNRATTGAIVRRQPFGGWKRSVVGSSAKSGGPHYLCSLGTWSSPLQGSLDDELEAAAALWPELAAGVDPSGLAPELNVFRLCRLDRVSLRFGEHADTSAQAVALGIASLLGAHVDTSAAPSALGPPAGTTIEEDAAYIKRLPSLGVQRVRLCGASGAVRLAVLDMGLEVDVVDLSPVGRVELLHWAREQAISATMHRHGNLAGDRAMVTGIPGASLSKSLLGREPRPGRDAEVTHT
jgi:RHH-type proline utilization regulon transcriptional repressor/proline dehydrogenase/delta 1-pyrroline-5-carboxylate dehydrogenase